MVVGGRCPVCCAKAAGEWSKQSKVKGLWGMTHQFSSSVCSTSAPLKAPVTTGILQQLPPRPHTVSHMGCNSRLWHRPAPNPVCEHRGRSQKLHSLSFYFAEKCHHWTFRNCWYGTVVMQSAETLKCTALTQIIFRDMNVTFPAFISFFFSFGLFLMNMMEFFSACSCLSVSTSLLQLLTSHAGQVLILNTWTSENVAQPQNSLSTLTRYDKRLQAQVYHKYT